MASLASLPVSTMAAQALLATSVMVSEDTEGALQKWEGIHLKAHVWTGAAGRQGCLLDAAAVGTFWLCPGPFLMPPWLPEPHSPILQPTVPLHSCLVLVLFPRSGVPAHRWHFNSTPFPV